MKIIRFAFFAVILALLTFPISGGLYAQQSQNSISVQGRLNSTDVVSGVQVTILANGVSVSTAAPIELSPDSNGVFTSFITGVNLASFQVPAGYFEVSLKKGDGEIAKIPLTAVPFALAVRGVSQGDNLVAASGNVGIGTIEPAEKLTVAGNVLIDGDFYARNFVGAVMYFAGGGCPGGWLIADGSTRPVNGMYSALFTRIGYAYGPPNSGDLFALPMMLDGSFIRSVGGYSEAVGTKQEDIFQGHYHNFNYRDSDGIRPDMPMNSPYGAAGTIQVSNGSQSAVFGGRYITNPRADANGNGVPRTGPETRPRNYAMLPCIKY